MQNLVSCFLEAPTFSKQQNGPSYSKLVRSKWYQMKLKKTHSRIIDDKVMVTLQLGLNPNFVTSIQRSEDELFYEWKSNNPTKFLFDVELDESDGGRTEIIRQSEDAVKFNLNQKKQEIKLKIRINFESEQVLINQNANLDVAFLLSVGVAAQNSTLQDSVCCQVKFYEKFKTHVQNQIEISPSTKLERQGEIQLERYEKVDIISHVVPETETRVIPVQSFNPKTNTWNVSTVAQISVAIFLIAICIGFFVQFQKQIKLLESKLDESKLTESKLNKLLNSKNSKEQKLHEQIQLLETKISESTLAESKLSTQFNKENTEFRLKIGLCEANLAKSKKVIFKKNAELIKENWKILELKEKVK